MSTLDPELLCPVSLEREQKELFMQVAGHWSYLLALIFKGTVHQISFLVSLKRMF